MIRLAIAGATGRVGRCTLELAARDDRFEIAAALTKPGRSMPGTSLRAGDREVVVTETLDTPCDVLIDFTVGNGTITWLEVCERRGIPMVIGATGHDDRQLARIREAAHTVPVLKATNFSVGIQAILNILGRLTKELGESYDVEIVEAHHRDKLDAPSGTALTLVDEIAAAMARTLERDDAGARLESRTSYPAVVFGRHGHTGERPAGQIGVHAMRMGDIVSQHEIHFGGPGETVTIRHVAQSNDTFAAGALRAAAWIVDKPAGFYSMREAMAS